LSFSLESEKVKMESQEKQDTTTGKEPGKTSILASEKEGTVAKSKPVQVKNGSASTEIASILAVLQTDLYDLQSLGLRVAILARDGKLYASIEWEGHVLDVSDTGKKSILLDFKPVVEYE
jgi:hypothetical protein